MASEKSLRVERLKKRQSIVAADIAAVNCMCVKLYFIHRQWRGLNYIVTNAKK